MDGVYGSEVAAEGVDWGAGGGGEELMDGLFDEGIPGSGESANWMEQLAELMEASSSEAGQARAVEAAAAQAQAQIVNQAQADAAALQGTFPVLMDPEIAQSVMGFAVQRATELGLPASVAATPTFIARLMHEDVLPAMARMEAEQQRQGLVGQIFGAAGISSDPGTRKAQRMWGTIG